VIARILCPFHHHACYNGFVHGIKMGFLFSFFRLFSFWLRYPMTAFSLIVLHIHTSWDTWVFGDWEMKRLVAFLGALNWTPPGRVRKVSDL
jgi:hypothetical protein